MVKPRVAPLPPPVRTPNPFASFDPLASPVTPSPPTLAPTPNRRGMHDRARDPLSWSISSNTPRSVAASMRLVDRARSELAGGTADGAFELLDQALVLDPESVPAYVERARASILVGSMHGAREDLDQALALQPTGAWLAEVVAVGGEVYEIEGREDTAVVAYRRALVIHPPNRTAREALSRLLAR